MARFAPSAVTSFGLHKAVHDSLERRITSLETSSTAPVGYSAPVGAGTAVQVTHGIGTMDVTVQVYRASSPYDTVVCDVERVSPVAVLLRFASAVTDGQYRVVVSGVPDAPERLKNVYLPIHTDTY